MVAEALLQGYPASIVGSWTHVKINRRLAAVQLAAQRSWRIADVNRTVTASIGLYVLVDVTYGRRDFYVIPGDELRRDLAERYPEFMSIVGGERPHNPTSRQAAIYPGQVEAWRNRWALFGEAAQPAEGDADA
ncbi:hypothetical protein ADL17_16710 [Micromonospora maris]|uniref:Uncharacterized protein n=1 Tax=Micromonospora maris TaxID=1003110 RepID=A0A9X0LC87_9ACTN|nr:hypothetical protein ADL17_16710 [Micromonospora maris]